MKLLIDDHEGVTNMDHEEISVPTSIDGGHKTNVYLWCPIESRDSAVTFEHQLWNLLVNTFEYVDNQITVISIVILNPCNDVAYVSVWVCIDLDMVVERIALKLTTDVTVSHL